MYLLQYLRSPSAPTTEIYSPIEVEYRLACSGELYNRKVKTFDWRKSDAARILSRAPLELFVSSQPFSAYPQELCARLTLNYVTEHKATGGVSATVTFLPDEDVIEDLCSMLSLLARRLISPVGKTRERRSAEPSSLGSYISDTPVPVLPFPQVIAWAQRPITIFTSLESQRFVDNSLPPVGVDPEALSQLLLKLPSIPGAESIVYASRLYRAALEVIESRPDIAYLLLISTVESLADVALRDYEPCESDKAKTKMNVSKLARELGLDDEKASQLAVEACRSERWLQKKFKKFLLDRLPLDELALRDRVFPMPQNLCPPGNEVSMVLGRVYKARSANLHRGLPFPKSVGIGTTAWIKPSLLPIESPLEIPPVPWFERVVSLAARKYLFEQTSINSEPFLSTLSDRHNSPNDESC